MSFVLDPKDQVDGLSIYMVAGAAVQRGEVLYVMATGLVAPANASAVATMPAMGIALNNAAISGKVRVLRRGIIVDSGWAWNPGAELYVATAAGAITQTAPINPNIEQQIGIADNATRIDVDFQAVGGISSASGCAILEGATAYVGFDSCKSPHTNYFLCDGTADDVQIQAALDYVNGLGGGSVVLERGLYDITASVVFLGNEINLYGNQDVTLQSVGTINVITATNRNNISIESLRIHYAGTEVPPNTPSAIIFTGCVNSAIKKCRIDQYDKVIQLAGACDRVIVAENKFDNGWIDTCVTVHGTTTRSIVAHNLFIGIDDALQETAIEVDTDANRNIIIGNQIYDVSGGSESNGIELDANSYENLVIGNTITECRDGIKARMTLAQGKGAYIIGNTIEQCFYGCHIDAPEIVIEGNEIRESAATGIRVTANGDHVNITGNIFVGNDSDIETAAGADHGIIANNYFKDSTKWTIIINGACDYWGITGNHLSNCGRHGIYSNGGLDGVIADNIIVNTGDNYACIHLLDTLRFIVTGNQCIDDRAGSAVTDYGIEESGTSDYNLIKDNKFLGMTVAFASIIGANDSLGSKPFQFTEAVVGGIQTSSPIGVYVDANTEQALTWGQIPSDVQQVVRLKVWAVAKDAPVNVGGQMHCEFTFNAGASNAAYNTANKSWNLINHDSEEADYVADDVVHWVIEDGDVGNELRSLAAGDRFELFAIHEAAADPDGDTDAKFSVVEIEYV